MGGPTERGSTSRQRVCRHATSILLRATLGAFKVWLTSLLPRMKSQPSGCAHSGSLLSPPHKVTSNGITAVLPCARNALPTRVLDLPYAWVIGAIWNSGETSRLWNILSPGKTIIGNVAGKNTRGASAPCSKAGYAHPTKGGSLFRNSGCKRQAVPCLGQSCDPSSVRVGSGNAMWPDHSPRVEPKHVSNGGADWPCMKQAASTEVRMQPPSHSPNHVLPKWHIVVG